MGVTGLLILLQMLLINVKLVTSLPFCDKSVLDYYIRSIADQEKAMNVPCQFSENVTLPQPNLNAEWRRLQTSQQEADILHGFTLLLDSVPKVTTFVSQCKLELSLQRFSSNIRTLTNILQRVNQKTETQNSEHEVRTLTVSTLQQFYTVYRNILIGKYKTLIISLCKSLQHR
ncbi:erythropoietin-like [Hyla sarda]|uniref:erythropoietin-like n=1 Tax=Hyla sarda TaxID=327740 RepID=UPI0024C405C2|nr:erythropoietin-like [Hyla sarda]